MDKHALTTDTTSAKTDCTGFLHLPNEIRNKIYEDVLFGHDHEAVFLPRKLPRKVLADGCKITWAFINLEDRAESLQSTCSSVSEDDCRWQEGQRPPEEIPLPIFTEEETDDESEPESDLDQDRLSMGHPRRPMWCWLRTRAGGSERIAEMEEADQCDDCGKVYCTCVDCGSSEEEPDNDNSNESDKSQISSDDDDESEMYDEEGYLVPPKRCLKQHGAYGPTSQNCEFCGGFGFGPDQDEENYVDDETDDDDPLEEDEEHFDSAERMGLLFQTHEPSILLACKEIREQCLPLYYGSNAFSWRFFWGHQTRSLAHFTEWTRVVGEKAKYITQISFEGRHSIEEGIEFEVDVDLLADSPYFDVAAECIHPGDELTDVIVESIEQDVITVLWRMSRRDGGEIKLSSEDLCLLGTIFSESLQRDPGAVGDRGQWDGKYATIPRQM